MLPSPEEVAQDLKRLGMPCAGAPRLEPLPGDAGSRRYVRVRVEGRSLMLMLVPGKPDRELGDGETGGELPYLNLQRYLKKGGLPVPEIYGWARETGRLYQEDFGSRHLSEAISLSLGGPSGSAYLEATKLLTGLQRLTPDPGCIAFRRSFDVAAIRAELTECYEVGIPYAAKSPPSPQQALGLQAELDTLARDVAALPACFSHRDYHGDNLLVRPDGTLGMIDFQDAFVAPRLYDLASLLTDRQAPAFLGGTGIETNLLSFAGAGGIPEKTARREFWLCALQRQMKVAGRFVNLQRRGKPGYLKHLPATWGVIRQALPRAGFPRLQELLASLGCPV